MFTLYTINETIVIKPSDITEDSNEVLLKALSDKYLFKVIYSDPFWPQDLWERRSLCRNS